MALGQLLYLRGIIPAPLEEIMREWSSTDATHGGGGRSGGAAARGRRRVSAASRRKVMVLQRINAIMEVLKCTRVMRCASRLIILIGSSATRPRECYELVLPVSLGRQVSVAASETEEKSGDHDEAAGKDACSAAEDEAIAEKRVKSITRKLVRTGDAPRCVSGSPCPFFYAGFGTSMMHSR